MDGGKTILFLMRNLYYLRNFEAPLRALAARGHRIVVLADPAKTIPREVAEQADRLAQDFPGRIVFGGSHGRRDFRRAMATEIQCARDILHYHHRRYVAAPKLRDRATAKAPPLARAVFHKARYADPARNARADHWLARLDRALPPDDAIAARLREIRPDLVVVTPLIDFRTTQIDWVRAAHHLGVPTVLAVASWDNLTSKSRIQAMPHRVLVWNGAQKREAIELHSVPEDSIVVTGAQLYDQWFERSPSCGRAAFCSAFGFDPERPIVLYVGSSHTIARDEPIFVRRWLTALRACAHKELAAANVLIRPHPMNQGVYRTLDVDDLGRAAVHPRQGGFPVTESTRRDYFDALHHAAALVGVNTSALVEASILGKTCFTVRDPSYRGTQEGTLHFHHLVAGGIVRQADDFEAHFADLSAGISLPESGEAEKRAFVADFIRPHGLDEPATPRFVAAIEEALALRCEQKPVPVRHSAGRVIFDGASLAVLAYATAYRAGEYLGYLARGPGKAVLDAVRASLRRLPTNTDAIAKRSTGKLPRASRDDAQAKALASQERIKPQAGR